MKRSKPMSRGKGFKRPELAKRERVPVAPRAEVARATLRASARPIVAVAKGVKAKPGKGAPTNEECAWMDWITSQGCIACRLDGLASRPPAVHHILRGGRRIGHLFTLPLCDPGHHQGGEPLGMISRHPWKARFEAKYGSELQLLNNLRRRRGLEPF